ncbi:hypothetical protein A1O1_08349 [Capronia coronata CBS 617.96]|uniref:F-box domain-containing protein n=1 Tax=Capronia coronata CBS 617.96 TaxID=1182541 RepID=W9XI62_9EURO|nr:uncharacterized protein A1O1_08349 [Capronia coronata CBS 617.96]EXJ80207.1 hypothetical protein A1O1_08349 [Capronia coronata CBS 617.96]
MKVGDPIYRGDPVPLPVEVIWLIASYNHPGSSSKSLFNTADSDSDSDSSLDSLLLLQKTLWACCLVSRPWYTASIEHLYNRPVLNNRNFDLFVRTIAPSPSSVPASVRRKPRLGLEKLIKHLDMSGLSYESSKSLTARLIRRTKDSLESFAAPAITFSIPSLAPLSKCLHLRSLDLSTDYYDIDLPQLLDAIDHLDRLTTLKLPRNALWADLKPQSRWPKNLRFLQVSHRLYEDEGSWATLFDSWPETLKTLRIAECLYYSFFKCLDRCPSTSAARTIRTLEIGPALHEDRLPLGAIMHAFPMVKTLVLPAYVGAHKNPLYEEDGHGNVTFSIAPVSQEQHPLENLVLRDYNHVSQPDLDDMVWILSVLIDRFPRLRRIELPERYFSVAEDVLSFEALTNTLEQRADKAGKDSAGIFLLDASSTLS